MRIPQQFVILSTLGAFLLVLAGPVSGGDAPKATKIEGKLAEDDDPDKLTKGPSKKHTAQLKKGKQYAFTLKSEDFDAFLRLEDPDGKQLAVDDDSAGDLDSLIRHIAQKDGAYHLFASSLDKKPGAYVLLVQESDLPKLAPAKAVPKDGLKLEDKLTEDDPADILLRRSPSKRLAVKLDAGQRYRIDMDSDDFDCVLRLEDEGGKQLAVNDDRGKGTFNSTIVYTPAASGVYVIIMTNLDAKRGSYSLRVMAD